MAPTYDVALDSTTCDGSKVVYIAKPRGHSHFAECSYTFHLWLMALIDSQTGNKSSYHPDLNAVDEFMKFDGHSEFEPFSHDQNPTYRFDETFDLGLDGFDPECSETFNSSLWPSPTVDYVRFQEERPFPFDTTTILQGGSTGWHGPDGSHNSASTSISQDHSSLSNSSIRERSRGAGSQSVECPECQQVFDSLHFLEQHTKKESHKIWRCLERNCGKAYPRRDTLSRHQLKHSAKGHACIMCQQNDKRKVFKRRDHLAEHVRKRHSPSIDGSNDGQPRKQEAMQDIVKSLETVLGGDHQVLRGLGNTMTGLSDSRMTSVAETIAKRIAQAAADQSRGCDEAYEKLEPMLEVCRN